jgi:hypothetical protein
MIELFNVRATDSAGVARYVASGATLQLCTFREGAANLLERHAKAAAESLAKRGLSCEVVPESN